MISRHNEQMVRINETSRNGTGKDTTTSCTREHGEGGERFASNSSNASFLADLQPTNKKVRAGRNGTVFVICQESSQKVKRTREARHEGGGRSVKKCISCTRYQQRCATIEAISKVRKEIVRHSFNASGPSAFYNNLNRSISQAGTQSVARSAHFPPMTPFSET